MAVVGWRGRDRGRRCRVRIWGRGEWKRRVGGLGVGDEGKEVGCVGHTWKPRIKQMPIFVRAREGSGAQGEHKK